MKRFDGKQVLITGGLGTIGRALSAGFLDAGGAVTVLDQPGGAAPAGMGWLGLDLRDLKASSAAVAPGAVSSEAENRVFADKLEEYQSWILKNQCLKQRIEAQDVAELAMFLASDAARMITGQNIHLDGGW